MGNDAPNPAPNEQTLEWASAGPPSIIGHPNLGILAAWWNFSDFTIIMANDQSSPPFESVTINPTWTTNDTPALALALDWENVFLAWSDLDGAVHLSSAAEAWNSDTVLSETANSVFGPALCYGSDLLYAAWQSRDGHLVVATCDRNNTIEQFPTQISILSRPSLMWDASSQQLYAFAGGTAEKPGAMAAFSSGDGGKTFAPCPIEAKLALGPPSVESIDDYFYFAWADGTTRQLCYAATKDLAHLDATTYSDVCLKGGPALLATPDGITLAWTDVSDNTIGRVTLAREIPMAGGNVRPDHARFEKRAPAFAPRPCPPPLLLDPVTNKCVLAVGCYGRCVLSSFTGVQGFPVFNPLKYALCVHLCKDPE